DAAGSHRAGHGPPRGQRPVRGVQAPGLRSAHPAEAHGGRRPSGAEVRPGVLRVPPLTATTLSRTTMPRAIDMHVHLPMDEWLDNAIGPHLEATEAYFRARVNRKTIEEVAEDYRSRDVLGVVLDWDDHTVTGRGWMGND